MVSTTSCWRVATTLCLQKTNISYFLALEIQYCRWVATRSRLLSRERPTAPRKTLLPRSLTMGMHSWLLMQTDPVSLLRLTRTQSWLSKMEDQQFRHTKEATCVTRTAGQPAPLYKLHGTQPGMELESIKLLVLSGDNGVHSFPTSLPHPYRNNRRVPVIPC